ncbi:hypothetical protein [Mixta intestinalis]|jgi:hypothetical protein|uniref:Uncharacterized protein n=1 Tax=Mixta intestinalis TaxID=1615494 RepID=A0A6P1PXA8_9GAMM|nr:hypothetical protein [Mixta intestinalis]QHM70963.1 hypothetical protein C7M51_01245 [Mixta intestinalis]
MGRTDLSALKNQSDRQLALRLEKAVEAVRNEVITSAKDLRNAAQRLTFYTSCFFDDYQDVCKNIEQEDKRFILAIVQLIKDRNTIYKMLQLYYEIVFKNKKQDELLKIRDSLIKSGIRVSAGNINGHALSLAVATATFYSFKMNNIVRRYTFGFTKYGILLLKMYSFIPVAKKSAERLHMLNPAYYRTLYAHNLEMMFFLVEPFFIDERALRADRLSDDDIVKIIKHMIN